MATQTPFTPLISIDPPSLSLSLSLFLFSTSSSHARRRRRRRRSPIVALRASEGLLPPRRRRRRPQRRRPRRPPPRRDRPPRGRRHPPPQHQPLRRPRPGTLLHELDLSNNAFTGPFPEVVLRLGGLKYLDLRFNDFHGPLPPELFDRDLDALFLNDNRFDSHIPENFGNIKASAVVLANNKFAGCVPRSIGRMRSTLNEIVLSNNKLSGCLPPEIGSLKRLTVFDVSRNFLSGGLPESFSGLEDIEQLNLAHNTLVGVVPDWVCRLKRLANLSVSDNYFAKVASSCKERSGADFPTERTAAAWVVARVCSGGASRARSHQVGDFPSFILFYYFLFFFSLPCGVAAREGLDAHGRSEDAAAAAKEDESFDDESKLVRTVFVGNLPVKTRKKAVLKEFGRFGEIESVRLRSVPLLDSKIPRKGAIIQGKISDAVDSIHAYIVFKDEQSAHAALSHNMALIGGNHIRVDMACPPRKKFKGNTPIYDRKRTIFVGNLPFDVKDEELYQLFCGASESESNIEAVRVIRDPHTSLGKGIAYVLFKTRL